MLAMAHRRILATDALRRRAVAAAAPYAPIVGLGGSIERVAILSFHSHGDRSFLDDRELAVVSAELRADGVVNDLVLVAFGADAGTDASTLQLLIARLASYDVVVFERVWSAELVAQLRAALPGTPFIHCRGEHALEDPPADYVCGREVRQSLPRLLAHLRGAPIPPLVGTLARRDGAWIDIGGPSLAPPRARPFVANVRPVIVNPEAFPATRSFSVVGNAGCPYQADARDNPVYAGVAIPEGLGRGCAFCTTGNHYEARPPADTAASVLEQLRFLRREAPELQRIVLKDQNPLGYLTEVVSALADERLGPFTLMLETRADWLTRNARRFDDALAAARRAGIRISPFLVGIESFSQPELDRYNKGTTAAANEAFLASLWALRERHGETLDLESASFGFVLFTPWTTLDDLETNLRAIQRTRFDRLRGRLLLSRARLYPDTALYYLAQRDGLLAEAFREGEDSSRRYGYYPAHPWRFERPEVAHFAALATTLTAALGGRDELAIFERLVAAFRAAADPLSVTSDAILASFAALSGASVPARLPEIAPSSELHRRFADLVRPLAIDEGFAGGFRLTALAGGPGLLRASFGRDEGAPIVLEIVPRGDGARYARSRHYDLRYRDREASDEQRRAIDAVCRAIQANDR
jgi:hypothetical protein